MMTEISSSASTKIDIGKEDWSRKVEDYLKSGKAVRLTISELNLSILKGDSTTCPSLRWIRVGKNGKRKYYDTLLQYKVARVPWGKIRKWLKGEDQVFESEKKRLEVLHKRNTDPFYRAVIAYIQTFLEEKVNNEEGVYLKILGLNAKHIAQLVSPNLRDKMVENLIARVRNSLDGFPYELIRMQSSGALSENGKRTKSVFYPVYIILIIIYHLPKEVEKQTVPVTSVYMHLCDIMKTILKDISEAGSCDVTTQLWLLEKSYWKYEILTCENLLKLRRISQINQDIQLGIRKKMVWLEQRFDSIVKGQTALMRELADVIEENKRIEESADEDRELLIKTMSFVERLIREKDELIASLKKSEDETQQLKAQVEEKTKIYDGDLKQLKAQVEEKTKIYDGNLKQLKANLKKSEDETQQLKAQMEEKTKIYDGNLKQLKAQMEEKAKVYDGHIQKQQVMYQDIFSKMNLVMTQTQMMQNEMMKPRFDWSQNKRKSPY